MTVHEMKPRFLIWHIFQGHRGQSWKKVTNAAHFFIPNRFQFVCQKVDWRQHIILQSTELVSECYILLMKTLFYPFQNESCLFFLYLRRHQHTAGGGRLEQQPASLFLCWDTLLDRGRDRVIRNQMELGVTSTNTLPEINRSRSKHHFPLLGDVKGKSYLFF